ncbi:hypothetical protein, partial [Phormidium sp. CCY1219]|uniref:hypothetical protein n=1 Tax=Phormidium sp. CCY1219 TaxID=2886104 RepID=UPI002D1F5428
VGLRLVSYLKSGARSPVSLERGADKHCTSFSGSSAIPSLAGARSRSQLPPTIAPNLPAIEPP